MNEPTRSALVLAVLAAAGAATTGMRPASERTAAPGKDSAAVVLAAGKYHEALRNGDSAAAVALLDRKAVILESGDLQTRDEYVSHHLASDIAFAKAVASPGSIRSVRVEDDMAWVASTSRSTGTFNGRAIDSNGAELMVLSKSDGEWTIEAIHWSSRKRAPAP